MKNYKFIILLIVLFSSLKSFSQVSRFVSVEVSKNDELLEEMVAIIEIDLDKKVIHIVLENLEYSDDILFQITGVFKRFDSESLKFSIKRETKDHEELLIVDPDQNVIVFQSKDDITRFKIKSKI